MEEKQFKPNHRRESPSVLQTFPSLRQGTKEYKIRLVQYSKSPPLLDLREYLNNQMSPVTGKPYTGFTRRGLTLDLEQCRSLMDILPEIVSHLEVLDVATTAGIPEGTESS